MQALRTSPAPKTSPRRAYPSDIARSERRRLQREKERQEARDVGDERQLYLDLAGDLEAVMRQDKYRDMPEAAARVNSLALSLRTRGNATPDSNADAILYAMSKPLPARLFSEIVTDTGLLKADVKKILDSMITCDMVRVVNTPRGDEYWPTGRRRHKDVLP